MSGKRLSVVPLDPNIMIALKNGQTPTQLEINQAKLQQTTKKAIENAPKLPQLIKPKSRFQKEIDQQLENAKLQPRYQKTKNYHFVD